MSWVAVAVAGAGLTYKIVKGATDKHTANQIDKGNPFPTENVQPEYQENVNQATNMAQTGLPDQVYNNQLNNIQRNQAGGLMALSRSANPGGNVASIVRSGDDATSNLNAQDAMARNRNLLNLLNQRMQLAQQKDKAWDWNHQQRYLQNLAKANAYRSAGNQSINSGVTDAMGTVTAANGAGAFSGGGSAGGGGYSGGFTDSSAGSGQQFGSYA